MAIPTLADLYAQYEIVNNESSSDVEKESAYRLILSGAKGGEKEKRLACQFIARFSRQFDALKEESFNCILDLCDDDDMAIRKQAIHDLLQFCKRIPTYISRVSDVLIQMFHTENSSELHLISLSLSQLLTLEPKSTLVGIFNQLLSVNPESPREHVMKFLIERLKTLPEDKLTTEVEEYVVEQTNKVLHDVSEDEFPLIISILSSLKCMSSVTGRQKLVTMITEQALQACPEFNPTDSACVAQIRESCKQAALCVSKNVHARELHIYLLTKVLPRIMEIPETMGSDRLSLFRVTTELCSSHATDLTSEFDEQWLQTVFTLLCALLPEVPSTESKDSTISELPESDKKSPPITGLQLSELECLLSICCHLCKIKPQFFDGGSTASTEELSTATGEVEEGSTRLRLIRPRLQYLSLVVQEYSQSIANQLTENGNGGLDGSQAKVMAQRLVTNIQSLVRNFFHNPPTFKTTVSLSWTTSVTPVVSPGSKRPATDGHSVSAAPVGARREQDRYKPPIGQWSSRGQSGRRDGGGGRGFKRSRGRRY